MYTLLITPTMKPAYLPLLILCLHGLSSPRLSAQLGPDVQPGVIRLKNGLVLSGQCSLSNTTDPLMQNQKLELRKIDQGFRNYLVSTRRSDKVIPDTLAVPKHSFTIPQRRTSQRAMNFEIGIHEQRPFQPDGLSSVSLTFQGNTRLEIPVGIIAMNSQYVGVQSLTHQWTYGVSMETLPDQLLYAGADAPSLVKRIKGFNKPETQLNVVETLLAAGKHTGAAGKYIAARQLLTDIQVQFPQFAPRCERLVGRWSDQVGSVIVNRLQQLRDQGQFQTALKYARRWPDDKLDPVVRVRAKQFRDDLETDMRRLETIRRSLSDAVGRIVDPATHRTASHLRRELEAELDLNTLPRLTAFELLGQGGDVGPEAQLALAVSGWLLGAENATDGFPEAEGLSHIRYLVADYVRTENQEISARDDLLQEIRAQEGFSPERVAAIIRHLPPSQPLEFGEAGDKSVPFHLAASSTLPRAVGILPAEYRVTRRYPMLVAFPRSGASIEETRDWWRPHTDRHGYVLVVPELYMADAPGYEASAEQHQQFIDFMVRLKSAVAVDDDRVFLTGHDIGGEAALDLGSSHPGLFAGISSIAGLGRRHLQWTAHNAPSLPWYLVIGTKQPFYYPRMELLQRKLFQRVRVRGRLEFCDVVLVRYPQRGFESYAEEVSSLFRWMNLQRRSAPPDYVEAVTVRSTDTDWHWLQLDQIPQRFCELDAPHGNETRPNTPGGISASLSERLVRVSQIPGAGAILLSPDLPKLDLSQPISIRHGSQTVRVLYEPSTRDMLDHFRDRRDRRRLCYMRVPL